MTAGPTREPHRPGALHLQPLHRKDGLRRGRAAARRGAEVVLVSGPVELARSAGRPDGAGRHGRGDGARRRRGASGLDLFVGAAAVSDFTPRAPARSKRKKTEEDETLVLTRTPDILARLPPLRRGARRSGAGRVRRRDGGGGGDARQKLVAKRCDLVVANEVGVRRGVRLRPQHGDAGRPEGQRALEGSKAEVAEAILDRVVPLLDERRPR